MPLADFEEKQYENAANAEFARIDNAEVYAAGQVAEALLAYDVALRTQGTRIWQLLGTGVPPGVLLLPNFWSGFRYKPSNVDLPSRYVSLIIQYKRATYLTTGLAGQWRVWRRQYYRFELNREQHLRLRRLELNLSGAAVVRYAAPVFHTRMQLDDYLVARQVLPNSTFASPQAIAPGHTIYSYAEPGTSGYSNPKPEYTKAETFVELLALTRNVAVEETLLHHLSRVAAGLMREPILRENYDRLLEGSTEMLQVAIPAVRHAIADLGIASREIGGAGASWWIFNFGP